MRLHCSEYCQSAYPNHYTTTLNFGGLRCGKISINELFCLDEGQAKEIVKWCEKFSKAHCAKIGEADDGGGFVDFSSFINPEICTAAEMLKEFGINEKGVAFNFGGATGLPHVCGEHEVLVPWEVWPCNTTEEVESTQIGDFIKEKLSR